MLTLLEKLTRQIHKETFLKDIVSCYTLSEISHRDKKYPIQAFVVGDQTPTAPVLFITGGVHGLERIGAQLAWSLLKTTVDRIHWDNLLRELFKKVRLVVMPLINPVGYYHHMRSNGRGVDLMRNSPVKAIEKTPFLLGGHRFSKKIPWFQGEEGTLEEENRVLSTFFREQAFQSQCVIAVDFHSGFGLRDRLWFPFSYTKKPFDELPEIHALTHVFEQTHPYHIYQIEPQSNGYLLSGDIWDHLFLDFKIANSKGVFLPLTLEMGSWTWVRKNPLQLFSLHGAFNPMKEHRIKRTYRRHHLLYEFLLKAVYSNQPWAQLTPSQREKHTELGMKRWY